VGYRSWERAVRFACLFNAQPRDSQLRSQNPPATQSPDCVLDRVQVDDSFPMKIWGPWPRYFPQCANRCTTTNRQVQMPTARWSTQEPQVTRITARPEANDGGFFGISRPRKDRHLWQISSVERRIVSWNDGESQFYGWEVYRRVSKRLYSTCCRYKEILMPWPGR
jgi:hypothetical protein